MTNLSPWSDALTSRLIDLWHNSGQSAALIGKELGVSRNAVLGKVYRLGLESHQVVSMKPRKQEGRARSSVFQSRERKPLLRLVGEKSGFIPTISPVTGAYTGMRRTVPPAQEPTKNQLRAMLAEAVRNTAAMVTP